MWDWLTSEWAGLTGNVVSFFLGLSFSIYDKLKDRRVRRGQTQLEIAKLHREHWNDFYSRSELAEILHAARDMTLRPLTEPERGWLTLLFIHMHTAYGMKKAGMYRYPPAAGTDIHQLFAKPAVRHAWAEVSSFHEPDFVAFVERAIR